MEKGRRNTDATSGRVRITKRRDRDVPDGPLEQAPHITASGGHLYTDSNPKWWPKGMRKDKDKER